MVPSEHNTSKQGLIFLIAPCFILRRSGVNYPARALGEILAALGCDSTQIVLPTHAETHLGEEFGVLVLNE